MRGDDASPSAVQQLHFFDLQMFRDELQKVLHISRLILRILINARVNDVRGAVRLWDDIHERLGSFVRTSDAIEPCSRFLTIFQILHLLLVASRNR